MSNINWSAYFDVAQPEPGATPLQIDYLKAAVSAPPTEDEARAIRERQANPYPPEHPHHAEWKPFDPADWQMSERPLPPSFLAFLQAGNGGFFANGDRELGILGTDEVREYLFTYDFPEYMPGSVPFALDGAGNFYAFDMRHDPREDGEYPVLFVAAGDLGYEDAIKVADSFQEACQGRTNPADERPES